MEELLLNLRHLRAFCEVERLRSISQAAEVVFLSQPAVTQAVAKLENLFDVAFFERVGVRIVPTTAGSVYAQRVRRALGTIEGGLAETVRIAGIRSLRTAKETLPLLTMTQLRAFVAVGSTNNFTLAARLLGVSQSSVHRSSRELESLIAVPLFEKTTKGIVLTRAGQALWQQLKLAFSELAQAQDDVTACKGGQNGTIVVGCMPLARHYVLPETIAAFSRCFPEAAIRVIESPYPDLLQGLRHGEIDFLIGALRDPLPVDDVNQEPLFSAALCIASRRGHPLAGRDDLTIDDLAAFPWVLPPRETPTRNCFERLMTGRAEHLPKGLIESSSQILIRGLLKESDRLTLISKQQVQFEVDVGSLEILDFPLGESLREIGVTVRNDWQPTSLQAVFLQELRRVAASYTEG